MVTIVGVAPPEFYGETQGNAPDVWLPMSVAPQAMATDWLNAPKAFWLTAMAREAGRLASPGADGLSKRSTINWRT